MPPGVRLSTCRLVNLRRAPAAAPASILLMGDGYSSADLANGTFGGHIRRLLSAIRRDRWYQILLSQGFGVPIYAVDVESPNSGIDNEPSSGGGTTGIGHNSYFSAAYGPAPLERMVEGNSGTVDAAKAAVEQDTRLKFTVVTVITNSRAYGGSGGAHVWVAGGNLQAGALFLHELGHTGGQLHDEYNYLVAPGDGGNLAAGKSFLEPNVDSTGAAAVKWTRILTPGVALPTSTCAGGVGPAQAGTVGTFEGAAHFSCGAFRSMVDCRMRTLGQPFCRACEQAMADAFS